MKRIVAYLLALCLVACLVPAAQAEDNPKNYIAKASGDNTALSVPDGKRCRIHSITFLCTKQSTAVVGLYVHDGTNNLCGEVDATFPIDKTGIAGPAGLTLDENSYGHMVTGTAGADVIVNLDAAQPVIVLITFTLF